MSTDRKLDLHITRLEFKAASVGSWTQDDLREEIKRRLSRLFLGHEFSDPFLESSSCDFATGHSDLSPPINVPSNPKSDLHPGTIEWAFAKLKAYKKVRRSWWPAGAYAFLLDKPKTLLDLKLSVAADEFKAICSSADYPLLLFVDPQRNVSIMRGSEFANNVEMDEWELSA